MKEAFVNFCLKIYNPAETTAELSTWPQTKFSFNFPATPIKPLTTLNA